MQLGKKKIGNKEVCPITISSGIVTTEASGLARIAREIPQVGILTTKSIGPESKTGNREPILWQYYPGCFMNAVGLTNPGAEGFAKRLSQQDIPEDRFLLCSIFGKNEKEFAQVAETLEDYVDGFELNLSCPHAKGYGMQLGQDPDVVEKITRAVSKITDKILFDKLTPNASDIGKIAKAALRGGAQGITAINTVGPGYFPIEGRNVLTNQVGGMSGRGIIPMGLNCTRQIRQAIGPNVPIIGMGGIATARDILAYHEAGADRFGIGSALAGMTERNMAVYFEELVSDVNNGTNHAAALLENVDMDYKKVNLRGKLDPGCDFKLLKTDIPLDAEPGQFVFAYIPGVGEKPFSVMDNDPLTLGILERGEFTKAINRLQEGDDFYVRGPYGQSVPPLDRESIVLVGGGCGVAGLYLLAKKLSEENHVEILLAAKDKDHLAYIDEFKKYGKVHIATEDGSAGTEGLVTDILRRPVYEGSEYFFNCGPRAMIDAVLPFELEVTSPERVYSSLDYMTKCGVGICGSCVDDQGLRTCVEGPFMNQE